MAKFMGNVGYADMVETAPGVHTEVITVRQYRGDIVRNSRRLQEGEGLNSNVTVNNSIEIVADAYAQDHFFAIRFAEWAGVAWTVIEVTVQHPRLLLRLGGKYNGNTTPTAPGTP